jgi:protein SCO1/2
MNPEILDYSYLKRDINSQGIHQTDKSLSHTEPAPETTMKQQKLSLSQSSRLRLLTLFSTILATVLFGTAAQTALAQTGHEMHNHDHAAHDQMHKQGDAIDAGMEDHSHHQQAMQSLQKQNYRRSVTNYTIPKMELVDMHGVPVSIEPLLNTEQPLIVNFIFTSCTTVCPILSATFAQAQKRMGEAANSVNWVSISIDPEYDTPARLREYAARYHAGPNWRFLTGDLDRIITLQKAFDIYRGNKMNHEPVTLLRAGRDQPWVRLDGFTSGSELVAEYQQIVQH